MGDRSDKNRHTDACTTVQQAQILVEALQNTVHRTATFNPKKGIHSSESPSGGDQRYCTGILGVGNHTGGPGQGQNICITDNFKMEGVKSMSDLILPGDFITKLEIKSAYHHSVYKNHEIGAGAAQDYWDTFDILDRQYEYTGNFSTGVPETNQNSVKTLKKSWVHNEPQKIGNGISQKPDFSWSGVRHTQNDHPPHPEPKKKDTEETTVAIGPAAIKSRELQLDNRSPGKVQLQIQCPVFTISYGSGRFQVTEATDKQLERITLNAETTTSIAPVSATTDASETGTMSLVGIWNPQIQKGSSKYKETVTLLHSLKTHAPYWRKMKIRMQTENITTKAFFTKGGTTANRKLLNLAKEWWDITMENNICVNITHIAGKGNVLADWLSKVGTTQGQPIYFGGQSPAGKLLRSGTRHIVSGSGCANSSMGNKRSLFKPTTTPDTSYIETSNHEEAPNGNNSSKLADVTIVTTIKEVVNIFSYNTIKFTSTMGDASLEPIEKTVQELTNSAKQLIRNSIRSSTAKSYKSFLKKFIVWSVSQKTNQDEYSAINLANFLGSLKLKPSSVLMYATAVSDNWQTLYPEQKPITTDRRVSRLLQGLRNNIEKKSHEFPSWDVGKLIEHITNW
ncbi:hypothetical protein BB558_003111 [Smittium angustum]|uniref:Uncharacterized protein n=1 Tax=Smittium angustum TaxID=133377 RepID=A0A2U1J6Y7_SMIAN|nr:hypothetical protein BB558_003111 [Smittium angustum]